MTRLQDGRDRYDREHTTAADRDYSAAAVKGSAVERGRARFAAQKGNASARAALAGYADDLAADDAASRAAEAD